MRRFVGAGIDHRNIASITDNIGLRSGKGIGRWIGRKYAADQRLALFRKAGGPRFFGHFHRMLMRRSGMKVTRFKIVRKIGGLARILPQA